MPTRSDLVALLERVRAATGADRRLDYELFCATAEPNQPTHWDPTGGNLFTASVDAALNLVERMLPGWCPELIRKRSADPEHWGCKLSDQWASYATPKFSGHGPTAPLAILAALLSALIAQHSEARHD